MSAGATHLKWGDSQRRQSIDVRTKYWVLADLQVVLSTWHTHTAWCSWLTVGMTHNTHVTRHSLRVSSTPHSAQRGPYQISQHSDTYVYASLWWQTSPHTLCSHVQYMCRASRAVISARRSTTLNSNNLTNFKTSLRAHKMVLCCLQQSAIVTACEFTSWRYTYTLFETNFRLFYPENIM